MKSETATGFPWDGNKRKTRDKEKREMDKTGKLSIIQYPVIPNFFLIFPISHKFSHFFKLSSKKKLLVVTN